MASGYKVNGTDLDSIFAPYHAGWPQAAATGYDVAGVDLNARYAPLSTGSAAGLTGYKIPGGADLNAVFAAYGSTGIQVATQPSNVSGSAAAGNPSGTVTSNSATCSFTKGSGSYSVTWHCTNCTANSPNSETTTFSATVNAGSTDNASAYCTGSDGVTTVNTSTIAVTLTNTTPAGWAFTLVAGVNGSLVGFNGNASHVGTLNGSYNPVQMPSTFYVLEIMDDGTNTFLVVSGVTGGDPGQNSLTSLIINGKTFTGSSAAYSFSSSQNFANWQWDNNSAGLANGGSYPGTLSGTIATG